MMISQNIVIFSAVFGPFVTAVLGAAVDAKGSSASLLAPPVDVRTEANVKPSELFGNLDFSHGLFTDIAVTKTKEHRRISQIHCRDSAEFGITWLSFSYKDFHNTAGPDVPGIEKTGWDHGHQGSGRMHDKVLVFGDVITKVVVHRRPSNWYKYQINYLEFWSVNGGQQAPLFSCGTTEAGNADLYTTESFPADLLVPAEDIHVFDGLAGSDYNGILNFKGAFSSYHHPSMRIIGVDYIPIDDF